MTKHAELIIVSEITEKDFLKLQKEFKKEVINSGLDGIVQTSVVKLQESLRFLINEQIRLADTTAPASRTNSVNGLGQTSVNPPQSEQEILKFLTNGKTDLSKYNSAKDYTTLQESGVVFGQKSKSMDKANRVALRMQILEGETVESQFARAKGFFQEAIFALPDAGNKIKYYANPGLDITGYIKIKCSTMTGSGNESPFDGMSPAERFKKDSTGKGFADWTLKQDGVDFIRRNFLDLTPIIEAIKEGDFGKASNLLRRADKGNKLSPLREQLANINSKTSQTVSMQSYTNTIELINNIQITKKIDDISTVYNLVSSYQDFAAEEVNFFESLKRSIRSWVVANEDAWFQQLVDKADQLIKKFESSK